MKTPREHSQYVTSLIRQSRISEADQAWKCATDTFCPNGEATPQLALDLHFLVASQWLANGEPKRARLVLNQVSDLQSEELLHALDFRLRDVEEAMALGASVRPSGMPHDIRWQPSILPPSMEGEPLSGWYPGLIFSVTEVDVGVVFATPEPSVEDRNLLWKRLTHSEWAQCCSMQAEVDDFVEIGEYGESILIVRMPIYP